MHEATIPCLMSISHVQMELSLLQRPERPNPLPSSAIPLLARNGYVAGRVLGRGCSGIVIEAYSRERKGNVAIKVCDIKQCTARERLRLKGEVEMINWLKGKPSIVELYDVKTNQDCTLIIMELAERGDLAGLIEQNGKLPEDRARSLFKGLLTALKSCHENSIVHGDIKSENCLLDKAGTLKLSDFGFSAHQHPGCLLRRFCGTYAYMAPEILLQNPYDGFAADLWSAGVVLYNLTYGRLPFDGRNLETLIKGLARGPSYETEVSERCRDLLKKILRYNPGARITLTGIMEHPWINDQHTGGN